MNKYTITHITDLHLIEPEDVETFCSELPSLIATLKNAKQVAESLGKELQEVTPFVTWQADQRNTTDIYLK
ncbi:MAG: hypothetical protein ACPG4U_11185 [Pseudomonadales bacterium]